MDERQARICRIARRVAVAERKKKDLALTLVIGLPGSGKSTFAKGISGASHYEADMYFINEETGEYNYDRSQIQAAHKWCQGKAAADLQRGKSVVISNTSLTKWEREPYYKIAQYFGAKIYVKVMDMNFGSVHDVPEDVIEKMKQKYEPVGQDEISEYNITML